MRVLFLLLAATALAQPVRLIQNATFINDGKATANVSVLVRDGKIAAIGNNIKAPRGAEVVDAKGKFLLPGFVSAHVHVVEGKEARQLQVYARYGITTVWSFGGEKKAAFDFRAAQDTASLDRSRIYVAGDVITAQTPDEARAKVAQVAALKPDLIKIRVDDNLGSSPKMKPEVYKAVIEEAHKHKLPVAVHIFYLEDAKDALRAGADIIAHSVRDREIDDEFIALMKQRNIPYIPTLTREVSAFAYETTPDFFADPFFQKQADPAVVAQLKDPAKQEAMAKSMFARGYKRGLATAKINLKKAADAGLRIEMGTDSGAAPNRFEGYFEHLEMWMMAEAGLAPAQVLRYSTRPLKTGDWADLILLHSNPLDDIRNTKTINTVWIAGNRVP
ncbi:organophopsphate acid anhydrase [Bryobacterales bacterium F-183]|nr:organophopsphate acid anhydrase [Bryobacterales bacterium F-183]